jgi:hypothetical protein
MEPTPVVLPAKRYESPLFKQVVSFALALALGYLAAKFGIQPAQPIEIKLPDTTMQTKEIHYHFDSDNRPSVKQKE